MKQFRNIDIFIFAVLATVANFLSVKFGNSMDTPYFYTLKWVVLFVVLMRWGRYGAISLLISNCLLYFTTDMSFINFVIYEVGAGMFFALPFFIYWKRDRNLIIKGKLKYLGFLIASHLSLCIGKGIAIFIIEGAYTGAIDYLASTLFIITIDILAVFLLRAVNGLVVDMEKYDLVNDEV
ncbi:MAG: hypothetical protein R3Y45_05110 [Bacillota bacterium]